MAEIDTVAEHKALDAEADYTKRDVQWTEIKREAERDEQYQHSLGIRQSFKVYKAACFWSIAASFCIIMEAYDTVLLGSLLGLPAFQKRFGVYSAKTKGYQLQASWQAGIQQGANIGSIFGVILGAVLVDRFGYIKSIIANLVCILPIIGLITFAPNKGALLAGELLAGIPWGVFSTLAEAYASEVCPISLRGYLTTWVNMSWVIGHFVGAGILRKAASMTGNWSYRMPLAVQWAWPVPLIAVLLFAPESPWWLVRKGQIDRAEKSLRRLAPKQQEDRARDTVSAMLRTNELEKDVSQGSNWLDCFRGTDLRRTEISVLAWTIQILCGLQFATYFFEQAGLPTIKAFDMTLGLYAAAFVGTCSSWFLLTRFGRRTIYVTGLGILCVGQFLIGGLSVAADHGHTGARWGQAGVMIGWLFVYDMTVGPLAYTIVGEVSSTRLRNKTIALSRLGYNLCSVAFGVMMPYMLNPTAWDLRGKTGFFWGGICFFCFLWAFFRLPEMKGRSYYEIDLLFERKTPARKFSKTQVSLDEDEQIRREKGITQRGI